MIGKPSLLRTAGTLALASALAASLGACGGGNGNNQGGGTPPPVGTTPAPPPGTPAPAPTPPPPPSAGLGGLEDRFGTVFGMIFRTNPNSAPRQLQAGDIGPVIFDQHPIDF